MENNKLVFKGKDGLTQKEQDALDALFKAMKNELNLLKKESPSKEAMQANLSHEGNQLTINIPNPKYFDAFIKRLVDKNLLVLADNNLIQAQPKLDQRVTKPIGQIEMPTSNQSPSSWTAPTPFSLVPKLKD